jgi:hypothetical protein
MESRKRKADEDSINEGDIRQSKLPSTSECEASSNAEEIAFPVPTNHLSTVPPLNNQQPGFFKNSCSINLFHIYEIVFLNIMQS